MLSRLLPPRYRVLITGELLHLVILLKNEAFEKGGARAIGVK
jgi:hypothetical protein